MSSLRPVLVLLPILCVGCGGVGDVTGKVSYKTKPLTSGTVLIIGEDGRPQYGPIQEDGTYTVKGVGVGNAKVSVSSPNPSASPTPSDPGRGGGGVGKARSQSLPQGGQEKPSGDPKKWFPIPDKYGNPLESGLTVTVNRGVNPLDIDLK